MTEPYNQEAEAAMIYCPQCGQAMRVATQHLSIAVACPHCQHSMIPQQLLSARQPGAPPLSPQAGGYSTRSKLVAGLLGILLGGFGAHRFYLGFHGIGVLQIILTLVTCGWTWIWGLVEGILCLTGHMRDCDGLPLRD